jgi:hypothetical protein
MARPTIDPNKRKQPVTISLEPTDLVILDNLARTTKKNRSQVISEMLVAKGFTDLGLSAIERHKMPVQNWPNEFQAKALGRRFNPDEAKACNPKGKDGKCNHQSCMIVYRHYGVI